jgi:hypothetical protein
MLFESEMRTHAVYMCSAGCGYVERGRVWDSAPVGNTGYTCPDCGASAWDYYGLSKSEAIDLVNQGYSRVERFYRL